MKVNSEGTINIAKVARKKDSFLFTLVKVVEEVIKNVT
jgi:hypothetical protein